MFCERFWSKRNNTIFMITPVLRISDNLTYCLKLLTFNLKSNKCLFVSFHNRSDFSNRRWTTSNTHASPTGRSRTIIHSSSSSYEGTVPITKTTEKKKRLLQLILSQRPPPISYTLKMTLQLNTVSANQKLSRKHHFLKIS